MDAVMVNPRDFQLDLRDELKLCEKQLREGNLDKVESRLFTLYHSVKNRNINGKKYSS